MADPKKSYYHLRGQLLVKNLKKRHFDAYYCPDKASALEKALELIPKGATVGWGGVMSAHEIGLIDAVLAGEYNALDREKAKTAEERDKIMKQALLADVFLTSANAISMDGQMVNIDGNGNRVAAIIYGAESVLVIAGMNKVVDTLEDAVHRARTIAAPMNKQRFDSVAGCSATGTCSDCKAEGCICNHIVITRHCRGNRIKFILVGEELGF